MRRNGDALLRQQSPFPSDGGVVLCSNQVRSGYGMSVNPGSLPRCAPIGANFEQMYGERIARQCSLNIDGADIGIATAVVNTLGIHATSVGSPSMNDISREDG